MFEFGFEERGFESGDGYRSCLRRPGSLPGVHLHASRSSAELGIGKQRYEALFVSRRRRAAEVLIAANNFTAKVELEDPGRGGEARIRGGGGCWGCGRSGRSQSRCWVQSG